MKKLLLLICIITPTLMFSQLISFSEIKQWESSKEFRKTFLEKGYFSSLPEDCPYSYYSDYAYAYNLSTSNTEYGLLCFADIRAMYYESDGGYFIIVMYQNGPNQTYNKLISQIKSECKFYDIKTIGSSSLKKEVICYTCKSSTYSGVIGFYNKDSRGIIRTFPK